MDAHLSTLLDLKRRWRLLKPLLPPVERDALSLAPALFCASFDVLGLKSDTPGLEGAKLSARHFKLAARLKLPAPLQPQNGRRLARAMLFSHEEGRLRVWLEPAEGITPSLVARVAERCAAATALFQKRQLAVQFDLLRPERIDPLVAARLRELGGLCAGRASPALTAALLRATADEATRLAWVPHAPTAYCRARLLLGQSPAFKPSDSRPFEQLQTLRTELACALRRRPLFDRPVFRAHLRQELLAGLLPRSLLPTLRAATRDVTRRRAPLLEASIDSRGVTLALPSGEPFARARTLTQARVRAMLLAQALWGWVPDAWVTGPQWKKLAQKLSSERARTSVLFALGPDGTSMALRLRAGREPRMRELDAHATLRHAIASAAAGHQVEVVPCTQLQELDGMRLSQIVWRAAANTGEPLAIERNGRTWVFARGDFKNYSTARFVVRPRRSFALESSVNFKSTQSLGSAIECEARLRDDRAVLRYRAQGWSFEESVPLESLQTHLQGTMAILTAHPERARLLLSLDSPLEKHLKSGRVCTAPFAPLELKGDVTRGLSVTYGAEVFAPGQLRALAETILSGWPVGVQGFFDVSKVQVGLSGTHGSPLACLYARWLLTRRLSAHIAVLVGLKRRGRRVEALG